MSAETIATSEPRRDVEACHRPRSLVVSMPGAGMLWFGGWLFTTGFAHLTFWKAVLGLVVWPYFLGVLAH
jgi:hypothetical protein